MKFFDGVEMLKNYKSITKEDLTATEVSEFVDFLTDLSEAVLHFETDIRRFKAFVDDFRYYLDCYEKRMEEATLEEIEDSDIVDKGMYGLKARAVAISDLLMHDCFTKGYFD